MTPFLWVWIGAVGMLIVIGVVSSLAREAEKDRKERFDKETREVAFDTSRQFHEFIRTSSKFVTLTDLKKLEIPTMEEILDIVFINLAINGYKPAETQKEKTDEVKTV